jgi:hypothetical protein
MTTASGDTYVAGVFTWTRPTSATCLPLAGIKWTIGAEAHVPIRRSPSAPARSACRVGAAGHGADRARASARAARTTSCTKPANYDDIARSQQFQGRRRRHQRGLHAVLPGGEEIAVRLSPVRRLAELRGWEPTPTTARTLNVGSNDYQAATLPTGDPTKDAASLRKARARPRSRSSYWLQTAVPARRSAPARATRT